MISTNSNSQPLIKIRSLGRSYDEGKSKIQVLDKLETDIFAGEIVVLLGRSGSGKSTLLNLISGIDLPSSGSIEIDSHNMVKLSEKERTLYRRRHIGFIFQFFNLIPTLTVAENLHLPLELNRRTGAEAHVRVQTLLEEVGLAGRGDSFPDRLSGGEQQRVAIARALAHEPKIILADEPTGNLDKETGLRILTILDKLVREEGRTMIMATHSPEVIGLADRILTFANGRLVERRPREVP